MRLLLSHPRCRTTGNSRRSASVTLVATVLLRLTPVRPLFLIVLTWLITLTLNVIRVGPQIISILGVIRVTLISSLFPVVFVILIILSVIIIRVTLVRIFIKPRLKVWRPTPKFLVTVLSVLGRLLLVASDLTVLGPV